MPYMDQFRARMLALGQTEKERMENRLERDFDSLCARSPDHCEFTYEGEQYIGVLSSGARSAAQSETRIIFYLWGPKSVPMPEGSVITTEDTGWQKTRYWIIMNAEVHPMYGYFKYKMLELDYMLKYIGSDGLEHSIPCYVNGTGTFDIKEYFKFSNKNIVEQPNRALNIVWSSKDDMDKDCRFIIGKETWRYVDSDRISIPGISYSTLYQVGIDESQDSVTDQVAGTARLNYVDIITNYGTGADNEEIYINDEFTDLKFYLIKDGKIARSNFEYSIGNDFAIINDDGNFELLGNDGTITVTDKTTQFQKTFNFAIDQIKDYFYIIGSTNIDVFSTNYYTINTDYQDITFDFDSDKINASIGKDGRLKVIARSILGETTITFRANNQEVGTLTLDIGSSW